MANELEPQSLLGAYFYLFVRQAFRFLRDGAELGDDLYLKFLCSKAERFAANTPNWMIVNLPPQHLKTFIFSICLSAWILGHDPSTRIIVVCNNKDLCVEIADAIREILRSKWFHAIFPTMLRSDRSRQMDFMTAQGGGVYAVPIGMSITGRGGHVLVIDDPLDIDHASNLNKINWVNATVATKYFSRLSDPSRARVIVIAHRLHPQDLTGIILAQQDPKWEHVCLPLVASKEEIMSEVKWRRCLGDILRPSAYSPKYIEHLRATMVEPNFDTFYQQDPSGGIAGRIKPEHFPLFAEADGATRGDYIVSIDTNQTKGSRNSNTAFLVFRSSGELHWLMDMQRGQWEYDELVQTCKRLNKMLARPLFLIEDAALGTSLLRDRDLRRLDRKRCSAGNVSKIERIRPFLDLITSGCILLPEQATWRHDYVREMTEFPFGKFKDCVDATSQYLQYVTEHGSRPPRPPRALGVVALKSAFGQPGFARPPFAAYPGMNRGAAVKSGHFPAIGFRPPRKP